MFRAVENEALRERQREHEDKQRNLDALRAHREQQRRQRLVT